MQALQASFGPQTPTIDLDSDGIYDVSPIDELFLMHGFFPADAHKNSIGQDVFNFDVNYQRTLSDGTPDALRGAVGWSDHHVYNRSGGTVADFHPRPKAPLVPGSKVQITVLDASGTPLAGATLSMVFNYPGGQQDTVKMPLPTSDNFVYLKLPPYFNYMLPVDAPLPACDPLNDLHANVTLSVEKAGVVSNESPTIDNCTFWQAVDATTGPATLAYTLTIPIGAPASFTLSLGAAGSGTGALMGAGSYAPGQTVTVSATPDSGSNFIGWSGPDAAECTGGTVVRECGRMQYRIRGHVVQQELHRDVHSNQLCLDAEWGGQRRRDRRRRRNICGGSDVRGLRDCEQRIDVQWLERSECGRLHHGIGTHVS